MIFFKQDVRRSSDDYAIAFFGKLVDDIVLSGEELDRRIGSGNVRKGTGEMNLKRRLNTAFKRMCNIVFVKIRFFGNLGYYLAVIVVDAEHIGKPFGDLTAAASEFTAYGYNSHNSVLLSAFFIFSRLSFRTSSRRFFIYSEKSVLSFPYVICRSYSSGSHVEISASLC